MRPLKPIDPALLRDIFDPDERAIWADDEPQEFLPWWAAITLGVLIAVVGAWACANV